MFYEVAMILTYNPSGAISNLIILRLWELNHEFGDLMIHIHHAEDGSAIVGDRHFSVLVHHHLIKACKKGIVEIIQETRPDLLKDFSLLFYKHKYSNLFKYF